jgi:hypothetical protein
MVGEPEQIRAVAVRLRADADRVRWLAGRVLATGDLQWHSPAAALFRARVADHVTSLRRGAADLETASRLFDVHAEAVSVARAELAKAVALGAGVGARLVGRG